MAQITRLLSAQLSKTLGLRETGRLVELADLIIPVLSIEPFLMAPESATPAPAFPSGLQPMIIIGTGAFSIPISTNRVGVLEVFGGASVSGTDPGAGKFSKYAAPPNRDWLLWGAYAFLGKEQAASGMEMNVILQRDIGTGPTQDELLLYAVDAHAANENWQTSWPAIMLPRPYAIAAGQQLYFKWQANNTEAVARNADLQLHLFWEYA